MQMNNISTVNRLNTGELVSQNLVADVRLFLSKQFKIEMWKNVLSSAVIQYL